MHDNTSNSPARPRPAFAMARRGIISLSLTACAVLASSEAADAEQVLWTLPSTIFDGATGGGAVSGQVVFDADTLELLFWDFTVDSGFSPFTAFRYQSGVPGHIAYLSPSDNLRFEIGVSGTPGYRLLFIQTGLLPDAETTVPIASGQGGEVVADAGGVSQVRTIGEATMVTGIYLARATPGDVGTAGCRLAPQLQFGDPVNVMTGAFLYDATLLASKASTMPFIFQVYYDSARGPGFGTVGQKWTYSYQWQLTGMGTPRIKITRGDGAADYFDARIAGAVTSYVPTYPQSRARLEDDGDGTFTYTDPERMRYAFDVLGRLESITDRNGQTATLTHAGGQLLSVDGPAPALHRATLEYNGNGNLVAVDYDSGLMRIALTYDADGNLSSFSSPTNPALTNRFTYDGSGNLLTGTAGTGPQDDVRFVENTYSGGRIASQCDANCETTTFAYNGSTTTITDPNGCISTRTFDDVGRITVGTNAMGHAFTWDYDPSGNLCRVDGPRGVRTMSYQAGTGNLMGMVNERGDALGMIWVNSILTGVVDGNGELLSYQYDAAGNLETFSNPEANGETFEHDANGRLMRTTSATNESTAFAYNGMGEIETITTAAGSLGFAYDALGRVSSTTDERGNVRAFAYDASGAVSSVCDAMGNVTLSTNDAFGNLMRHVQPDGRSIEYERDGRGDVTCTINAMGHRIEYGYDPMGMLNSKMDPMGHVTAYEYNPLGQVERVVDAMQGVTSATFDAAGLRETITDPNGRTITFGRDALGRIDSETDPLSRSTQTIYNSAGSISQVTNARSQTITYQYDNAGSLNGISTPEGTINYTLDGEGKRISATDSGGTTTLTYDDAVGSIASRTDDLGNQIQYDYDAAGNLVTLTYSDGKTVTYTYDAMDRMKTVVDWQGRTTVYDYDVGGNLVGRDHPDGSSVAYTYDVGGRLTSMTDNGGTGTPIFSGRYTYDAAGHTVAARLTLPLEPTLAPETTTITYDAANQIETVNGQAFGFDPDGNMTSAVIDGVATTLVYDARNRLLQHGSDVYRYDSANLRVEATHGGVTTRCVWDGSSRALRLLEEQDASGTIIARYVHGIGLIGREDAGTGDLSVYHYDKRGSTVAMTDPSGAITDRYAYDPYGAVAGREGSTPNPFTYCGRDGVVDDGNGLYYMTSRYYVPSLGRFAQQETLYRGSLFHPASLNRYAYVFGNPIDEVDPSGEWGLPAVAGIVGAVTSGVVQVVDNAVEGKPWCMGVAGAVVEGGIGGASMFLGPWGQAGAAGAAAGLGYALNYGVDLAHGRPTSFDLGELATDVAVGAATSGAMAKLFPGPASPTAYIKNLQKELPLLVGGPRVLENAAKNRLIRDGVLDKIKGEATSRIGKAVVKAQFGSTDVSKIIAGLTGRVGENCNTKVRSTIPSMWGTTVVVRPGNYYLNDNVTGVISGNPQ